MFLTCKHVLPAMLAQGGGSIVNISSLASIPVSYTHLAQVERGQRRGHASVQRARPAKEQQAGADAEQHGVVAGQRDLGGVLQQRQRRALQLSLIHI